MPEGSAQQRRKRNLIDKSVQLGLPGRLAVTAVAAFLLFFLLVFFAPVISGWLNGDPVVGLRESLRRAGEFGWIAILPLAAAFLALMAHGVRETHKIVGPAYRLSTVFTELARDGRIAAGVKVRQGDYLQGVADSANEALHRLHAEFRVLREELALAECHLERMNADSNVELLRENILEMKGILERYRLEGAENPDGTRENRGETVPQELALSGAESSA